MAAPRSLLLARHLAFRPALQATAAPQRARRAPAIAAARLAHLRWSSSSSSSGPSTPASSAPSTSAASEGAADPNAAAIEAPGPDAPQRQQIGQIEPMLSMTFTCTAGPESDKPVCNHRSTHEFKKRSYEKGIVLVQCPECKARHLIADHLGWFKESTEDGKLRTVEDLLRAKGEEVKKGRVNMDGDIEYTPSN